MPFSSPIRRSLRTILAIVCLAGASSLLAAQPLAGGPHPSRPRLVASGPPRPRQNQEHLAQWMDRHRNLPLAEQQTALQNEPGFRQLPPQTQQRMLDRLTQLNSMPDAQRQRLLERTEAMEHLTVPQRQQVRSAMQQLGALPVDRRRLVARTFRELRDTPPAQRQAMINSDRIRGQFSDEERSTLSNLLAVEPYLPIQRANEAPEK